MYLSWLSLLGEWYVNQFWSCSSEMGIAALLC